ncbi:MAG: 2,3-dihydroxybiphenyl 1,2-dioxygenase [Limisphaerales bacterium]|jgi:2,3-dihydroxybiphenyl 1,2-dioxygenase
MNLTSVAELAYVELGVSSLPDWQRYATHVLGLSVEVQDGTLLLKMDDALWRIKVVDSGEDDIRCAGFRVHNEKALQTISQQLHDIGFNVNKLGDAETTARGVDTLVSCIDPFGMGVELFVGDRGSEAPFVSPQNVNGFVAGDQGLGHIVLFVADASAAVEFYQSGLGFRLSDHITMGPEGGQIELTFLHCNARHHSLALAPIPVPRKLNHIMLEVTNLDDVGFGLDRAMAQLTPISSSIGCHTNDKMVSFYMQTPSGFDIEYGFGGIEIDDDTWQTTTYDKPSIWGHKGNLN